jgi:NAD+ synthase (glutamine-hydrolysing)
MAMESFLSILPDTKDLIVSLGLPLRVGAELFNAAALIVDGEVRGFACKRHLARDGLHYEPRWFSSWPAGRQSRVAIHGQEVPVGDLLFDVGGVRLGFEICEDAWVRERIAFELGRAGASILLGPSASHFAFGKHLKRRKLVLAGAHCVEAYVYSNLLGNEAGRAIYDGDCLIARGGRRPEVLAETSRLSFRMRQLACTTLRLFARRPVEPAPEDTERSVVSVPFVWPEEPREDTISQATSGSDPTGYVAKRDALSRAIPLGLFDYMRKSHSKGFVVSLSGGADSAAVALLVRLMARLAYEELGEEELKKRLSYLDLSDWSEQAMVKSLLMTVYQASENSSSTTRDAAVALAQDLGATHCELSIEEFVAGYRGAIEKLLGRSLSWETDDIALQNIQARARAPSVWMLANVRGSLLLSTSNRSEAAVGYATMDGDTSGGLSPIGGVDKAFLRKWLVYMEKFGLPQLPPVSGLSLINQQKPTAELRPPGSHQTDEADLMPYDVLDVIERSAVIERLTPAQVLQRVREDFPESGQAALGWVKRFYQLFSQNQWKRERYAPSFHVDDGNLDPKTWCRFPILSGGFRREMRLLEERDQKKEP